MGLERSQLVYSIQNHDQIGNRALGERLSAQTSERAYRAASMLLLFMPATPLLFMGQEWAATTPFLYFTDHEAALGKRVTEGRRQEFGAFGGFGHETAIPDPQSLGTFNASKLAWDEIRGSHARVLDLYRSLIAFRREDPVMKATANAEVAAEAHGDVLVVRRKSPDGIRVLVANLGVAAVSVASVLDPMHHVVMLSSDALDAEQETIPGETCVIYRPARGGGIDGESGRV